MDTLKIRVPVPAIEPRGSVVAGLVVDGLMRFVRLTGAAMRRHYKLGR